MLKTNSVRFLGVFFLFALLTSCDPNRRLNQDYLYFQQDRGLVLREKIEEITIKPNDQLNIQIISVSTNQEQAALFNLQGQQGYLVSQEGKIEMPLIGAVAVAGQTREQLEKNLQTKLRPHVKDPSVTVRIQNFTINVLGDVNGPGPKTFPKDKVTILDAISAAGDLQPTGRRDNVTVIRDHNGVRQLYEIDLRSNTLFESPVYQLQQNDIVYVNANKDKLKALKPRSNILQVIQTAFGFIGVATSLYFIFRNN